MYDLDDKHRSYYKVTWQRVDRMPCRDWETYAHHFKTEELAREHMQSLLSDNQYENVKLWEVTENRRRIYD